MEAQSKLADGDGSGVFMPDMTDTEFEQYEREHTHGWKPFYDKLLGRSPDATVDDPVGTFISDTDHAES